MSTPAVEALLAREFDLEINTGTTAVPVWADILGITGISPGQTAQRTDDTDYDTDGWESHTVVMRGRSMSVSLLYKEDPADGATDPGQQAVIDLADATGTGSKAGFRYTSPGGTVFGFRASVDMAWPGGDKTNNATATAELVFDGKPTTTPAP